MQHLRVDPVGQAEFRELEVRLAASGPDFDREVAKQLRKVPPKFTKLLRAQAEEQLPKRGGYAPIMAKALKTQASVTIKRGMVIRIWADGKGQRRDLPTINRGRLRHPLFGDRKHWHTTRVRPGFVQAAAEKAEPLVVEAMKTARDNTAHHAMGVRT